MTFIKTGHIPDLICIPNCPVPSVSPASTSGCSSSRCIIGTLVSLVLNKLVSIAHFFDRIAHFMPSSSSHYYI